MCCSTGVHPAKTSEHREARLACPGRQNKGMGYRVATFKKWLTACGPKKFLIFFYFSRVKIFCGLPQQSPLFHISASAHASTHPAHSSVSRN
jgi:hypothetical protein